MNLETVVHKMLDTTIDPIRKTKLSNDTKDHLIQLTISDSRSEQERNYAEMLYTDFVEFSQAVLNHPSNGPFNTTVETMGHRVIALYQYAKGKPKTSKL